MRNIYIISGVDEQAFRDACQTRAKQGDSSVTLFHYHSHADQCTYNEFTHLDDNHRAYDPFLRDELPK